MLVSWSNNYYRSLLFIQGWCSRIRLFVCTSHINNIILPIFLMWRMMMCLSIYYSFQKYCSFTVFFLTVRTQAFKYSKKRKKRNMFLGLWTFNNTPKNTAAYNAGRARASYVYIGWTLLKSIYKWIAWILYFFCECFVHSVLMNG